MSNGLFQLINQITNCGLIKTFPFSKHIINEYMANIQKLYRQLKVAYAYTQFSVLLGIQYLCTQHLFSCINQGLRIYFIQHLITYVFFSTETMAKLCITFAKSHHCFQDYQMAADNKADN